MSDFEFGPIRFVVEHRLVGGDGGPTLRVHDSAGGRELLRFDCFAKGPHWHVDPGGNDVISTMDGIESPLDWVLGELRRDLPGYLARAKFDSQLPAGSDAKLDEVEKALRNLPSSLA